ncbi:MAG: ABC transporter substrate-binding protein [Bacteroidales bacterium]|nr:ABC transporter substrate-binding protein [Bacteroidales bacterium]
MKFTDSLKRNITIDFPPKRIISLVPSITELLFDLDLDEKIVGITSFCIHPEKAINKTKIGGTKTIKFNKIDELKPDLIIAEKAENEKIAVLKLAEKYPVYIFDIHNFDDALNMIRVIGNLTNKNANGRLIIDKITRNFIENKIDFKQRTVFYPIWKNPFFTINNNTFINSILEICNLKNVFADKETEYPIIDIEEIINKNPEIVFLPSEPYNFKQIDKAFFQKILPKSKIINVDGEMFSWYGSRMIYVSEYLRKLEVLIYNNLS